MKRALARLRAASALADALADAAASCFNAARKRGCPAAAGLRESL